MSFLRDFHTVSTASYSTLDEKVSAVLHLLLTETCMEVAEVSKELGDAHTRLYVVTSGNSNTSRTTAIGNELIERVTSQGTAVSAQNVLPSSMVNHSDVEEHGTISYIGVPVNLNQQPFGTLTLTTSATFSEELERFTDYTLLVADWLGSQFERIRQEEENNRLQGLMAKLEASANIGTWTMDLEKNQLNWSPQTKTIHEVPLDYTPDLDRAIEFYTPETRDYILKKVRHSIDSGDPYDTEVEIITAKGRRLWVRGHGVPEFVDGVCVRLFGTFQDVDDEVRLRKELESKSEESNSLLEARSKLLAKISHELRTPLNGITGMLLSISEEQDAAERKTKINLALRSSDILLRLINDVLDYAKIEHGSLALENSDFALSRVFYDLASIYRPLCTSKGLDLVSRIHIEDDVWVCADSTRLAQIISNLLSNAYKFTETGYIKLAARLKEASDGTYHLLCVISDTGMGMTEKTRNALFTPFEQGESYIANRFGGTGLGLSIVRELVDMMEGQIDVKSSPGNGTTFSLRLPLTRSDECVQSATEKLNLPTPDLRHNFGKILVVDDNEINRIVMQSFLEKFHLEADFAIDGLDAVNKATEANYDLIFMDSVMPEMDGLEATREIKGKGLVAPNARIVALTANTSDSDRQACREAGMDGFLAKPITLNALKEFFASVVKSQR